tara:strand:- start:120 stop:326 length:207 start_codon:yes stop_codon:yes gene_type:complete
MNLVDVFKVMFIAGAGYALIQAGLAMQDTDIVRLLEGNGGLKVAAQILVVSGAMIIIGQVLEVVNKLR